MHADTGLRLEAPALRPRIGFRTLLAWIAARDARYRARLDLGHLDQHLLRDIGLTDADVAEELRRGGRM
jgi:uncharacterized protein YjiS (DUF1127 family)